MIPVKVLFPECSLERTPAHAQHGNTRDSLAPMVPWSQEPGVVLEWRIRGPLCQGEGTNDYSCRVRLSLQGRMTMISSQTRSYERMGSLRHIWL